MTATHLPLSVSRQGEAVRVSGHIAKANRQAAHLAAGAEAMAIFASPHGYVSPRDYEPGNWVPTWNYVAVHAYGIPVVVEGREAKLAALAELIADHDAAFQPTLDAYPVEFIDAKLKGIVAFEFVVSRLEARWKLSQDRQPAESERIPASLSNSGDALAARLAEYMRARPERAVANAGR
jgi:transcriptional regulator